jgi:hypothetical protein
VPTRTEVTPCPRRRGCAHARPDPLLRGVATQGSLGRTAAGLCAGAICPRCSRVRVPRSGLPDSAPAQGIPSPGPGASPAQTRIAAGGPRAYAEQPRPPSCAGLRQATEGPGGWRPRGASLTAEASRARASGHRPPVKSRGGGLQGTARQAPRHGTATGAYAPAQAAGAAGGRPLAARPTPARHGEPWRLRPGAQARRPQARRATRGRGGPRPQEAPGALLKVTLAAAGALPGRRRLGRLGFGKPNRPYL